MSEQDANASDGQEPKSKIWKMPIDLEPGLYRVKAGKYRISHQEVLKTGTVIIVIEQSDKKR